mgnify:CR=1 FL=1|tara:strand:+ start:736 stop:1200 length:465 start_codon:yes stop_codon:yes gene_type:complete
MIIAHKKYYNIFYIIIFFLLYNCQLQKTTKNHGILFLENRYNQLQINVTNINDVLSLVGTPHTKSVSDKKTWIYIERVLSKGKYHKLGQHVVKENNVMVLTFNRYGILEEKNFYDKEKLEKIKFSKKITENNLSQKSFVQQFLQSIKTKMYGNK